MDIYTEIILEHYKHPHNYGGIKNHDRKTSVSNPLCGDRIEMQVLYKNNRVAEIKFSGQGCAVSLASASILTDFAKNKSKDALQKLDKESIINMLGINLGPNRLKCALLSLEALKKLLNSKS